MKKRLAQLLRRLAQRLEPRAVNPTAEPLPPPIEFIGSIELARELVRRHDCVVLVFGRVKTTADGRRMLNGEIGWHFADWQDAAGALEILNEKINEQLEKKRLEAGE